MWGDFLATRFRPRSPAQVQALFAKAEARLKEQARAHLQARQQARGSSAEREIAGLAVIVETTLQ